MAFKKGCVSRRDSRTVLTGSMAVLAGLLAPSLSTQSFASELYSADGWTVRLDTTLQYSLGVRVAGVNDELTANINGDDGDRNLSHGIISDRTDIRSEFDVSNADHYGFSASADGWYDSVYNQTNQNDSPGTVNQYTASSTGYAKSTRNLAGKFAEIDNAFVYGTVNLGDVPVTLRAGRYTLLWGESLFFARNGIANGQSPVDIIKQLSLPDSEAKDLFMPEAQTSFSAQLTSNLSLEGFYQLEWRRTRLPPAGSYYSNADLIDAGGERLFAAPGVAFYRGNDFTPDPGGTFGLALRWGHNGYDFGLYATQYNDHDPQIYVFPSAGPPHFGPGDALDIGNYDEVFHKHIQAYGFSVSTSVGDYNIAGEISGRHNMDLQSSVTVPPYVQADGNANELYAVGDTFHYQGSVIYVGPAALGYDQLSIEGEVAGVHVIDIYRNPQAFNRADSMDAIGTRAVITPTWFQVRPSLDVNGTLGIGFNPIGNAPTDSNFNGGANRGGDITLGVSGTYNAVWNAGFSYTRYIGPPDRQPLSDRDFVSFTVKRTF